MPFVKEACYLRKDFNEELANKESGCATIPPTPTPQLLFLFPCFIG